MVVGGAVVPPHKHLNGQAALVAGSPQARIGQSTVLSGTGEVAQLYD